MYRVILIAVIGLAIAGCASTYKSVAQAPLQVKLEKHTNVYVTLPSAGQYGPKVYPDSGRATTQAVAKALAVHVDNAFQAPAVENLAEAMTSAKQGKFRYLFETTILAWEDRATEWSGLPDKISLKFSVYDSGTGERLATTVADASSKWATFGGDHPQDLLPVVTQTFVDSLF